MARLHQSELSSYARCPELYRLEREGLPGKQLSITAYGTLIHYCALNIFEQRWRRGEEWQAALDSAIDSFVHFWHPANIAEVTEPVSVWLPMQSWSSLNERGPLALRWYAEWTRDVGDQLLATEYSFQVPIPGTWDDELGEPHLLAGTVDRLSFEFFRRYPTIKIADLKAGKVAVNLRQRLQFSAYSLASTLPEFWTGWRGEEGFGEEHGLELYGRFKDAYRRGEWVGLRDLEIKDAGWRGPLDYQRFATAVTQLMDARKHDIYPLSIDGTNCTHCSFRDSCAGIGVPPDDHGGPSGR